MSRAVDKYLIGYAEREAASISRVAGPYAAVLVVPVCRERVSALDGFTEAARSFSGRVLCVLVVNARKDAAPDVHADNEAFLGDVRDAVGASHRPIGEAPPIYVGNLGAFDVLVVDRATEGNRFLSRQGVGLARKIGADIAVALHRTGKAPRWIHFTDADATLPNGYFDVAGTAATSVAALSFSFWHTRSGDERLDVATALYEVWLRYYVLSLAAAGSPYAMHTLGSAIAVSVHAYASARGVPKREAGEDFYLMNKLAKIGLVSRVDSHVVELRARSSDRAPFGTGHAVRRLMARSDDLLLYDPRCFDLLAAWLRELAEFCQHTNVDRLLSASRWAGSASDVVLEVLQHAGGQKAVERIARQSRGATDLWRRLHIWFDAFRTLKLIHGARDAHFAPLPWREALARAGFGNDTGDEDLTELRHRLRCREREQCRFVGPWAQMAAAQDGARCEEAEEFSGQ